MFLAIDIGNTNIVIGKYKNNELVYFTRIVTDAQKSESEYAVTIKSILSLDENCTEKIEGAIISSVVPPLTNIIKNSIKMLYGVDALVVGPGIKTGINLLVDNPAQVGADLICACVADGTKQSLSLQFVQGYTSNNQDLYTVFELDGNIYSMKLSASVEALRNAKEFTADEMLYKETDPAGVSRTLGFVEGIGYQYQVIKGYYVFNGQIQLTDMSTNKAVNIYENEDLINCVTSIVKSMR